MSQANQQMKRCFGPFIGSGQFEPNLIEELFIGDEDTIAFVVDRWWWFKSGCISVRQHVVVLVAMAGPVIEGFGVSEVVDLND
ncbi:hypothetical protein Tco_0565638 [Tanacetum coccineum]